VSPASRQSLAAARMSAIARDGVAPQARVQHNVIRAPRSSYRMAPVVGSGGRRRKPVTLDATYSRNGSIQNSLLAGGVHNSVQRRRVPRQRT
jgi:hypothetical protein